MPGPPHRLSPAPSLHPAQVGLFLGQTWSSGWAGGLHPGPSAGTLPAALVPRGASWLLHPQPRPAHLGLRGWLRAARFSARGWGACGQGTDCGHMGDGWASCWVSGGGGAWAGSTLGTPSTAAKQASPRPSSGRMDRPRGLPGDGRDPGWGDQNPSHPVFKALQLACPVIGPATARPQDLTQPHRVCACV